MKFNFKIQQYQTDAVDAVVKVFNGQNYHDGVNYIRDIGKMDRKNYQMSFDIDKEELEIEDIENDTGYKNENIELTDEQILANIQSLQNQNNI